MDTAESSFFTNIIKKRIKSYLTSFVYMLLLSLAFLALGVYFYIEKNAAYQSIVMAMFFAAFSIFAIFCLIRYFFLMSNFRKRNIPFVKVLQDDKSQTVAEIIEYADKEFAQGSIFFNNMQKKQTKNKAVLLQSYLVVFTSKLLIIPTKNILWAYGDVYVHAYRVIGLRQTNRTYLVSLFYKGRTGFRNKKINFTYVIVKNSVEGELFLRALIEKFPYVLAGKSDKLLKMFQKDQDRMRQFFEKYALTVLKS